MKRIALMFATCLVATVALGGSVSAGNGAPSGAHYNLNIIGVKNPKTADMTGSSRHTIFVPLSGSTRILLSEGEFAVLDGNGTDGSAAFQLPNPDPDNDGTTWYSVYARALGTPKNSPYSLTTTCATHDGVEYCSVISLKLERTKGKSTFQNVTKYLLYVYADTDGDGVADVRVPLFSDQWEGFLWDYDNHGLKLAQLRFYECATTVPDVSDPGGDQVTEC